MISAYLRKALQEARYELLENGTYYGEVPSLPGVIATADSLEACRDQLAEVIEEWILVRVAKGLKIPPLGPCEIEVRKAS